jgi:GNAT superfamily N-acetyltransferase
MPLDVQVERVERDRILEIRARVLVEHGKGRKAFSRDLASTTRHWAALVDGAVVGCVSVMRLRGHALRGMAVVPELQRQGIGARMLRVVCGAVGAPMWCNSRLEAVPFYVRMGWHPIGPVFDLQDRGAHQRLTWPAVPAAQEVP